jgi:hypothetical protein
VRELQCHVEQQGLLPLTRVEEETVGPGRSLLIDPDGNPVLIDQHDLAAAGAAKDSTLDRRVPRICTQCAASRAIPGVARGHGTPCAKQSIRSPSEA